MDLTNQISKCSLECLNFMSGHPVEGAIYGGLPLKSDSDPQLIISFAFN